jgi:type IV secretion system protein TrbD
MDDESPSVRVGAVPLHQALTEPMLSLGMPRNYLICVWGAVGALVLGAHNWAMVPIGVVFHIAGKWATKYDWHFMEVIIRHLQYRSVYP